MQKGKNRINRLLYYKDTLFQLKELGFTKVFSDNLADANQISSSQVRQDFATFNITGNRRGGYLIDDLLKNLDQILGKNETQKVIIIGVGQLGSALINYYSNETPQIEVSAAFDINPLKIKNKKLHIDVLHINELKNYIKNHHIKIGIITVPKNSASQIYNILIKSKIKGILNFSPTKLLSTSDIFVNNINFEMEFDSLIYNINEANKN